MEGNEKTFCIMCGDELEPGALFCSSCGAKQEEPSQIQSQNPERQIEASQQKTIHTSPVTNTPVGQQEFCCPQCHSENIQSYQMVYSQNVSTTNNTTTGMAVGYSGGFGVGVGGANTTGVSVTNLGQSVAPPSRRGYSSSGCLWAILAMMSLPGMVVGKGEMLILPVLLLGGYFYYGYRKEQEAKKWNQEVWPQLYDKWQHSYMCMKCGHRFLL